jgi:hypothetical protein
VRRRRKKPTTGKRMRRRNDHKMQKGIWNGIGVVIL